MTYLTRVPLDFQHKPTLRLLANPQALHATVAAAGQEGRYVFRQEEDHLLILTPNEPNQGVLQEAFGDVDVQSVDYTRLLDSIKDGKEYRFKITANPVRNSRVPGGARGKRVPISGQEKQIDWLLRLGQKNGFGVSANRLGVPEVMVTGTKALDFKRNGAGVALSFVTFEGVLKVSDAGALRAALVNGLGPAKGYGAGLLTLTTV